jgi:hypothetical protein
MISSANGTRAGAAKDKKKEDHTTHSDISLASSTKGKGAAQAIVAPAIAPSKARPSALFVSSGKAPAAAPAGPISMAFALSVGAGGGYGSGRGGSSRQTSEKKEGQHPPAQARKPIAAASGKASASLLASSKPGAGGKRKRSEFAKGTAAGASGAGRAGEDSESDEDELVVAQATGLRPKQKAGKPAVKGRKAAVSAGTDDDAESESES